MTDTYRPGDDDFDFIRSRFYDMVERHLSRVEPPAPKKSKPKAKQEPDPVVIDGRPVEVEKYGNAGIASYRNNASDAMSWLIGKGMLNSLIDGPRTDRAMEIAWAEGRGRITVAGRLDDLFERAELTPLKSPDFEAVPGGSFGPRAVHHSKIGCMKVIQDLRREIPGPCMSLLEAIICRNEFPWLGKSKKEERRILQDVRRALDFAHWALDRHHAKSEVTREELCRRWPEASEFFRLKILGPAVHSARVTKRSR